MSIEVFGLDYKMFVIPLIGGVIGYATNYIAVKMIFRPKVGFKIGPIAIQGLIPKRKKELSTSIAKTVEENLISTSDIKDKIMQLELGDDFKAVIDEKVDFFVENKLLSFNPILSAFITDDIKVKVKAVFMAELDDILPSVFDMVGEKLDNSLNVGDIVTEKVNEFSTDKLEDIVLSIAAKELKAIEILGGVLGILIGIIQVVIIKFL